MYDMDDDPGYDEEDIPEYEGNYDDEPDFYPDDYDDQMDDEWNSNPPSYAS